MIGSPPAEKGDNLYIVIELSLNIWYKKLCIFSEIYVCIKWLLNWRFHGNRINYVT